MKNSIYRKKIVFYRSCIILFKRAFVVKKRVLLVVCHFSGFMLVSFFIKIICTSGFLVTLVSQFDNKYKYCVSNLRGTTPVFVCPLSPGVTAWHWDFLTVTKTSFTFSALEEKYYASVWYYHEMWEVRWLKYDFHIIVRWWSAINKQSVNNTS